MTPSKHLGKFIAFDGIDGSGKGTLIELLQGVFETTPLVKTFLTKQPGGSDLGDEIRRILFETVGTKNIEPDALELLFLANHVHNTARQIVPALEAGNLVIADRHWPSAIAYMKQRGADDVIRRLYLTKRGVEHDLLFLLIGDPNVLAERARNRPGFEGVQKQAAKKWSDPENLRVIQDSFLENFGHCSNTVVVDTTWAEPEFLMKHFILPRICRVLFGSPTFPPPKEGVVGIQSRQSVKITPIHGGEFRVTTVERKAA